MTGADAGLLMLCCRLGEETVTPLSYRQFHGLRRRMSQISCDCDRDMTESDLRAVGIPADLASQILRLLDREAQLEHYMTRAAEYGITVLTRADRRYPRVLERKLMDLAPPVLFCRGDTELLHRPCAGLVGSRKLHGPNRVFAQRVGKCAAEEGYALVSGGARGADSAGQEACLAAGGSVIVFTPEALSRLIPEENVLFCSEEGWDLHFTTHRALSRNRLIHAMGEKTFVAQCDLAHGGSWRGAEESLKGGYSTQFVFWDGSPGAAGLLRLGAVEVTELQTISGLKTGQETFFSE